MPKPQRSVTFTVLIFVGMIIALAGVAILLLGLDKSATFDFEMSGVKIKTSSVGLAVLAVGSLLSAGVALNLPENVRVFGPTPPTRTERLKGLARPLFAITFIALLALVISLVVTQ
jgi:hypothetical protein